ncbi:MAG: amidohydrolase family protein [Kouleothrix sp.]|nr:amidohydrolase family protein [Kouleothrix sp.]
MTADQPPGESWHIRAVRLPDGDRAEDWWVRDGRLTDQPAPNARELPGGWMLPGLVDAHAHLSLDFNATGLPMGSDALVAANMDAQLAAGVLAVRDTGAVHGARLERHSGRGPRVVRAGSILAPPGRYFPGLYRPVAPQDLAAAALDEIAAGATWVKLIADFPGPDGNFYRPLVNYPPDTLRVLVAAAHAAGARVAAHVSGEYVVEVVRAGVDSIEHGPMLDRDLLVELAQRGAAWTPTLWTVVGYTEPLVADDGPVGGIAREVLASLRELVPLAEQLGVTVLAGSDEAPHGALAREIVRLCQFGMSARGALAAASTDARAYLGLPPLGAGAPADVVTFAADPRERLDALAKPAAVLFAGRRVV